MVFALRSCQSIGCYLHYTSPFSLGFETKPSAEAIAVLWFIYIKLISTFWYAGFLPVSFITVFESSVLFYARILCIFFKNKISVIYGMIRTLIDSSWLMSTLNHQLIYFFYIIFHWMLKDERFKHNFNQIMHRTRCIFYIYSLNYYCLLWIKLFKIKYFTEMWCLYFVSVNFGIIFSGWTCANCTRRE